MATRLTLGLNLPYVERAMDGATPRWPDVRAMARAAEEIGFDAVWISDHVGFGDPEGDWTGAWDAWTLLVGLAVATERVRLGTYVLCTPFRNPALLARMAETLDEISAGRLILGLGAGWNEPEFRSYGFPFGERFDRFEDSLRIICSMLRTGASTHDGKIISTRSARNQPQGPRPAGLPVMVGGNGARILRLTAELADHWNGGMPRPDDVEATAGQMDDACRAAGRDPATLSKSVEALVRILPAPPGVEPRSAEIGGTPEEIAATLRGYARFGIDHIQVQLRPNRLEAVHAFVPVIEAIRA